MMQQNVAQKTTSERLNTSRSPETMYEACWMHIIRYTLFIPSREIAESTEIYSIKSSLFIPRGVKRTVEAMRKPSISPTTMMQAMTEPKRHQLITRRTPPTTPITADRARQTAGRKVSRLLILHTVPFNHANWRKALQLTVIVQVCGPCDQHEEEKGGEAESHAKQLCMTERGN